MSIEIKNVNYFYGDNLIKPYQALFDINLTITEGEIVAIAGETGSGKSTLAEVMAGLSAPISGNVIVDGVDIYLNKTKKDKILSKETLKKIGMAFQYADCQLFEETAEKDIAFAPREMGFSKEEIDKRVKRAIKLTGLTEDIKNSVPYNLSGGEKKLVALAGILAFSPKYLILDEPTAGLDAFYGEKILKLILRLKREENITIIFISHNMDYIAEISDKTIIMNGGKILKYDNTYNCFNNMEILKKAGLNRPKISLFLEKLQTTGLDIKTDAIKLDDGVKNILEAIR